MLAPSMVLSVLDITKSIVYQAYQNDMFVKSLVTFVWNNLIVLLQVEFVIILVPSTIVPHRRSVPHLPQNVTLCLLFRRLPAGVETIKLRASSTEVWVYSGPDRQCYTGAADCRDPEGFPIIVRSL
jgi:hypothetical protein